MRTWYQIWLGEYYSKILNTISSSTMPTIKCMAASVLLELFVNVRFNSAQESRQFRRVVFIQLNVFLNLLIRLHLQSSISFNISFTYRKFSNKNNHNVINWQKVI